MDEFIITDVVSIFEFSRTGSTEGYPGTANYTNVNVCISPASTDIQVAYGDVPGYQFFNIIIYDITIAVHNADKIVTQDGSTYYVNGMPATMNTPFLSFTKVLTRLKV